jgi:hypothetical protein
MIEQTTYDLAEKEEREMRIAATCRGMCTYTKIERA